MAHAISVALQVLLFVNVAIFVIVAVLVYRHQLALLAGYGTNSDKRLGPKKRRSIKRKEAGRNPVRDTHRHC